MAGKTAAQKTFNLFNILLLTGFCAVVVFPYLNVMAVSLNDNARSAYSGLMVFPTMPTLVNYRILFQDSSIARSFAVTVGRIVFGVLLGISVEFSASYALSRRYMPWRRLVVLYLIVPTFISGGLIPTYILYARLRLLNNPLVYVLPMGFSFFNFILIRTFLYTIPDSLGESAKLDGAGELLTMVRIYLPPCAPILATIILYQAVYHWNDWTTTLYFVTSSRWNTLQFELQRVLREQSRLYQMVQQAVMEGRLPVQSPTTSAGVRNAQIIVSTIPIIIVYPFLQRYFIKGMLLGGVKE